MAAPGLAHWLWAAAGGAAGAALRLATSELCRRWLGEEFAWGTLVVNVAGCLAIGVVLHGVTTGMLPPAWRFAVAVGLLGGLTTFSSFGYETLAMAERGDLGVAAMNVVGNVVLGLGAAWAGLAAARALWPVTG